MLKRKNAEDEINLFQVNSDENKNKVFLGAVQEANEGVLASLMKGYTKLQIEDPIRPFYENDLQNIVNNVDYGVLEALQGTWVSYNSDKDRKMIGSGIHTTIMPSPGTNAGTIPGKYSFDCQ